MRIFNTSGPCDPERHYTLMRQALVAQGQQLVEQGRYFTLFAPRQAGKTTYFQLLFRQLSQQGYLPIWISFEGLKRASRSKFYKTVRLPLYHKRLITALRPLVNGEASEYFSAHEKLSDYAQGDHLQINGILEKYRSYVQRRGFHAFDTDHLKEGAWHYSLDGFINFFIERLGGQTFVEVPSGRGRTDILILYHGHKYVIETKIFIDASYFEHGKSQLADTLASEGLTEGFYVGFTGKHSETDTLYFDEMINGKRIYTWLIRTDFKVPSRRIAKKKKTV